MTDHGSYFEPRGMRLPEEQSDWVEEIMAEVNRLRAENAKLREALELAAGDLDAAAEDAGRSYYADRAQAAREAARAVLKDRQP